MSQVKQFDQDDIEAIEGLDNLIEDAELELERAATVFSLKREESGVFVEFSERLAKIESFLISKKDYPEDVQFILSEKVFLLLDRYKEVLGQLQPQKQRR